MDNGEPFFDISEGFFGNDNDPGASDFSWADEFISSSENQETNQASSSVLQQEIDESISASSSLSVIASQNNVITTTQPSFILTNTASPMPLANQNAGIQFLQPQQQQQQHQPNQSQQIITSLPNLIGSTAQLVRGPNGQLILTSGPIQVQQSQQTLQPNSVQFPSQQFQTPSQSPIPASSPAVNRPATPASSPLITKPVGSIHYSTSSSDSTPISSSKVHNQPLVGSAGVNFLHIPGNAQQQILARNIQVQGQTNSGSINVQGQQILQNSSVVQNQGHVTYLQGHGQSAMLQGQQGATAVLQGQTAVLQGHTSQAALLQGQQGHTAMLHGQGQNIVNTQNTVIQNPNVVNLNVAHVLCNNPALQNQQGGAVQQSQNIQGTLIQTADGKSIIIPSQLLQSGQPINLQNIQQVFQPQLSTSGASVIQGSSAGGTGLLQGTPLLGNNVTLGGIGNVIRMATNNSVAGQDKTLGPTHIPVIGMNSQGQQVLIQRAQGQQQNIMVRTLTPQNLQQLQQPSSNTTSTSNYQGSQASHVMQQPLLVSSQPGIQLQRIITPTGQQVIAGQQNQTVKVIGQNPAGLLSINLPQNISFQNPQLQTVQLLQQHVQRGAVGVKSEDGSGSQSQQVVQVAASESHLKTLSFVTKAVSQQGTQIQTSAGLPNDQTNLQTSVQNVFGSHVSVTPRVSVVYSSTPAATSQSQPALSQPIFSTTTQIPHVVPSVVTPQPSSDTKPPTFLPQATLQARSNAPKLTIQLTPETQKKLQLIQTELKTLQGLKQLTNEQIQRQKKLIDVQKNILQKCAQQQQVTLQVAQPMIGQPQASFPAVKNQVVIKTEVLQPMIGEPPTGTAPQQLSVVSSIPQGVIQTGTTLSTASPLLSALSSATTSIRPAASTTQNLQILNKVTPAQTPLQVGQTVTVSSSVQKPLGINLLQGTTNSTTPQAPVPTQIKIANHVLQLNLTPDQKDKVEGYLARMTPEQQQQQIKLFLNLQRQQQLQAQVQAQKAHQAKLQQGKIPTPVQTLTGGATNMVAGTSVPTGHLILQTGKADNKLVAVASMPKEQLIHQQLSKDQENAVRPDTHTPFHNQRDMTRRLLRYHVFQWQEPPRKLIKKDAEMFENCAEGLVRKSGAMCEKFRLLLLKESMRENSTAEAVMIQRLLNDDLKETIAKEKKQLLEDPASFRPIPLHILKKSERVAVKEEEKKQKSVVVKQEPHTPEQVPLESKPSSPFISIKEEEGQSRPTTPKFKLIIRNDGQKLTSSTCIAEDGDSDANTYIAEESSTDSYGDNNSDKESVGSRSLMDNIEDKTADDISMEDSAATRWSDISNDEKPFSSYMETESAEVSQMGYMNYPSNKMEEEETNSNSFANPAEDVHSLISSEDTVNYSSRNSFHPTSTGQSMTYSQSKALYRQNISKNSSFSGSFSALEDSQKSMESSANSYTGSTCAQYEPISSDEEDIVPGFVPDKSEPYSISIGKHTMKYSGDSSQSFLPSGSLGKSHGSSTSSSRVGVIEIADNDSNMKPESGSSSDSESDSEASSVKEDDSVPNYQMQSAIDSILQYDNASSSSTYHHHMDQSDFLNHDFEASQSEESAINSPQSYEQQDNGDHTDTTSMEDDLDAAVKSILM